MFSIIPDGAGYREFVLLKDGQGVLLRIATPDDIERVAAFIQGLKRHWLLRSAFRGKDTNALPAIPPEQLRSPKVQGGR